MGIDGRIGTDGPIQPRMGPSCTSCTSEEKKNLSCVQECVSITKEGKTSNVVWWWKWII